MPKQFAKHGEKVNGVRANTNDHNGKRGTITKTQIFVITMLVQIAINIEIYTDNACEKLCTMKDPDRCDWEPF